MVDVMGHFGMALLWAAPAWLVWNGRRSIAFIALALTTAMLPDSDLYLQLVVPVEHHGVTHTVVFVLAVALVAGAIISTVFRGTLQRAWTDSEHHSASRTQLFLFTAFALLWGGLSHIFADMLSAPDIADPVQPFWPLFEKPWSVDVFWYNEPIANRWLLLVALVVHAILAYVTLGGFGNGTLSEKL
ncbi:metal-dependent hydrolase [Haloarchaeobius sp. TZWWS8]|uniref:metal-dependent hydrolase n=1 Tax=Haloarchaeobius sp. TZWWS8 TaxID=3446121 RepID=UPI003EBA4979